MVGYTLRRNNESDPWKRELRRQRMNCPNCGGSLEHHDLDGVSIDECGQCRGRWFDRDELRQAKDKQDPDLVWLDFEPFGADAESLSVPSEGKPCPKCSERMKSLRYRESGVVIDKCVNSEGVWLDHKEFERIVDYLDKTVNSTSAREYAGKTFQQLLQIFSGPEGPVSETKDFLAVYRLLRQRLLVEDSRATALALRLLP
ncbi:MAG: zf-TFIIB domain-containing protein [Gaiellaceae bacterium]